MQSTLFLVAKETYLEAAILTFLMTEQRDTLHLQPKKIFYGKLDRMVPFIIKKTFISTIQ